MPPNIRPCLACGILIEKIDGDDEVMCGCEAGRRDVREGVAAGAATSGILRQASRWGKVNGGMAAGHPANERQVHFR